MTRDAQTLVEQLEAGRYEFSLSTAQLLYYAAERAIGHALFRRPPPPLTSPRRLNLGCGPHIYSGWVNADDYAFKRQLRETAFKPNWRLDITRPWRCPDNHWDGIFSEHVLEHVTYAQAVAVLREAFRTLKPGGRIRISVPDVEKYVEDYRGVPQAPGFASFPQRALSISFLTQMHMHRSTWNGDLMLAVLKGCGYVDAEVLAYQVGRDPELVKDDADKVHESLYVEARKP